MILNTEFGQAIALLSLPQVGARERLEWLTQVHTNYNKTELREQLRDAPRQKLSFNYANTDNEVGSLFNLIRGNITGLWAIPSHQSMVKVADMEQSSSIPIFDNSEFNDGWILIRDDVGYRSFKVIGQDANGLMLESKIDIKNGYVIPLRICIIDGARTNLIIAGYWSKAELNFNVIAEDSPELANFDVPTRYNGFDVCDLYLLRDDSSLQAVLEQDQNILDNEVGAFDYFTHSSQSKYSKPLTIQVKTQDELLALKNFLYRRSGRFLPFYMHTHEDHIKYVAGGVSANSVTVTNDFVSISKQKHIAVKYKDGSMSYHEITAIVGNVINFEDSLEKSNDDVANIYYLNLYRLNSDVVEIEYFANNYAITTIQIIEIIT